MRALLCMSVWLLAASAQAQQAARPASGIYTVQAGDTLSAVAARFGVSFDQIREQNPELDPDRIRVGQEIRLGEARRRIEHEIRAGDNATRIAERYGVTLANLREWNPRVDLDRIRIGRKLVVFTERPESVSESIGSPARGRLAHAVRVRAHAAYVIRDPDKAWGTHETARWLAEAFDAVLAAHPRSPKVRVHDVSNREGGFMNGHRSHQSGRDVDISYYQRFCGVEDDQGSPQARADRPGGVRAEGPGGPRRRVPGACPMWRLPPEQLDVARQWTLLEHWLRHDRVEAIFIDYRLQAELYRHAREEGASREELHRWFQYPRGRTHPLGIIRHYPQHDDHLHVRFACHESDADCR